VRMLVIGSCTKSKQDADCPPALRLKDVDFLDPARLRSREQELVKWLRPAAEMYTGRQHTQMMDGVKVLRSSFGPDACQVAIVSAGYGVLSEQTAIGPYDITFHGMKKSLIRLSGERLGIPEGIRKIIDEHTLVFLLLGDDYLLSARPPLIPSDGQKLVAFGSPKLRQVPGCDVVVVPAEKDSAREFHDGITTVKGKMFNCFTKGLQRKPEMLDALLRDQTPQTILTLIKEGDSHEPSS
jgi:hypothetical protein